MDHCLKFRIKFKNKEIFLKQSFLYVFPVKTKNVDEVNRNNMDINILIVIIRKPVRTRIQKVNFAECFGNVNTT